MKDWCLSHPYLTFMIAISMIGAITSLIDKSLDLFRKPQPNIINFKLTKKSDEKEPSIQTDHDPHSLN